MFRLGLFAVCLDQKDWIYRKVSFSSSSRHSYLLVLHYMLQ